jgi:hypothetical protein
MALQSLCSQDELWVAAVDREHKHNQERREKGECVMSEEEKERKFWRRRPDRVAIDERRKFLYLIEFKRTMDIDADYVEQEEQRADSQYDSLRHALRAVRLGKGQDGRSNRSIPSGGH